MKKRISDKKRVVMTTIGSLGDLHPYLALALEMRKHRVEPVIVTSAAYRAKVESLNIEFHPLRPTVPDLDTAQATEMVEKIMHPKRGAEYLFKEFLVPSVRQSYQDLQGAIRGADLFITHPLVLAGPLLAQKTGLPWFSTVLAPTSLWSDYEPFVPPTAPWLYRVMRFGGPMAARVFKNLLEVLTKSWLGPVYEFRKELGLPKGQHPLFAGQYSPRLNLALFSRVMCEPQSDWPAHTVITGFPFYDKKDNSTIDPKLMEFLDRGPAPIVFTLGSAAIHVAGDFYRTSIEAAKILNRRAVLLVGTDNNRPNISLPESIAVFNYAPYSELLPRAAAIVHQGGVGTTGQGLRAGIPMLVMPYNHDQPDNAARVTRLGVARTISRDSFKADRVSRELKELLENPDYSRRAGDVGQKVRAENGAAKAVELILNRMVSPHLNEAFEPKVFSFAVRALGASTGRLV